MTRLLRSSPVASAGIAVVALTLWLALEAEWGARTILAMMVGVPFVFLSGIGLWYWQRFREPTVVPVQPFAEFSSEHLSELSELRREDPRFEEAAFLEQAREVWLALQRGRARHELEPLRPLISDGVFERWSLWVRDERERSRSTELTRVDVEKLRLVEARSGPHFDELTVFARTRLRGHPLVAPDDKPFYGGRFDRMREECLTFLRGRGADSEKAPIHLERCPNCADPTPVAAAARCPSCRAVLRRDRHDWVLARVADRIDWLPVVEESVPGLDLLRERDPDWNSAHLEDRVAVIFWRLALAEHLGSVDPLRRVCDPPFYEAWLQEPERAERPGDWARRSIGEVSIQAFLPGEDWDRLLVEVRWLAIRESPDTERPGRVLRVRRPLRHLFVLGRRPGVRTRLDLALASAHCPGCGAPEGQGDLAACPFCGAVPSEDWLLLERHGKHERAAERWLMQARGGPLYR